MKRLPTAVRALVACGILTCSLVFPPVLATSAERRSDAGLLLWFLGLTTTREQETPRKIDVNSAPVEELAAVPGLGRREAQKITLNRPYATLQDLVRAGLSLRLIERLAALLTVEPDVRNSLPDPAKALPSRR